MSEILLLVLSGGIIKAHSWPRESRQDSNDILKVNQSGNIILVSLRRSVATNASLTLSCTFLHLHSRLTVCKLVFLTLRVSCRVKTGTDPWKLANIWKGSSFPWKSAPLHKSEGEKELEEALHCLRKFPVQVFQWTGNSAKLVHNSTLAILALEYLSHLADPDSSSQPLKQKPENMRAASETVQAK